MAAALLCIGAVAGCGGSDGGAVSCDDGHLPVVAFNRNPPDAGPASDGVPARWQLVTAEARGRQVEISDQRDVRVGFLYPYFGMDVGPCG